MSNPLGFLYGVSQSKARRYSRWSKRTTFPSRFPDLVHEDPQLHDTLQMLGVLTPDQRACVLLVHGFGWTYIEVAELLGMKRSEVNNHVHRGLTHLRAVTIADPLLEAGPRPSHEQENLKRPPPRNTTTTSKQHCNGLPATSRGEDRSISNTGCLFRNPMSPRLAGTGEFSSGRLRQQPCV
jgi:hypothetical protein